MGKGKDKNKAGFEHEDIIDFANYIFEQVKNQQDSRDKWMEIYLSIVGAVSVFATFTLAFFTETIGIVELYRILGAIFFLTGILGILFYMLFLSQRVNYKLHYKVLDEIQRIVIKTYLIHPYDVYYPTNRTPFKKFKRGADFFASIIQNVIIVVCFVIGCIFLFMSFELSAHHIAIICTCVGMILEGVLRYLYNSYEKII